MYKDSKILKLLNSSKCEAMYVGSTSRTLCIRTAEHKGISSRTGRRLAVPPHSAVRLHTEEVHDAPVRSEDFTILDSSNNPVSLRILESLYIYKIKPKLNETNSAFPLNMVG